MGIGLKWDITYNCNLNCKHCANGNMLGKIENELTTSEIFKVIDKLSKANIDYIHLLGGEPTARKDFLDIIKYMNKKNIDWGFNTNGLLLNNEGIKNEIINNKSLRKIVFSLEGPNAKINDKIRGKNIFFITNKNIKRLIELKKIHKLNNLSIEINTVVSKDNLEYIEEMIDFCVDLEVNQLNLLQLVEVGNAANSNKSISVEEELYLVELISRKYEQVKNKLNIVPRFTTPLATDYCKEVLGTSFPEITHGCGAGVSFAYLNNKGQLFPCDRYINSIKSKNGINSISMLNNEFYDILDLPGFSDIYELEEGNDFYSKITPCNNCKYLRVKCYPCPNKDNNSMIKSHNTVSSCNAFIDKISKQKILNK